MLTLHRLNLSKKLPLSDFTSRFAPMETNPVASAYRDPCIRLLLDGAIDEIPDKTLFEAIGKVTRDRIGLEWSEGGCEVEFRHRDPQLAPTADRCRNGEDCVAPLVSILPQLS